MVKPTESIKDSSWAEFGNFTCSFVIHKFRNQKSLIHESHTRAFQKSGTLSLIESSDALFKSGQRIYQLLPTTNPTEWYP